MPRPALHASAGLDLFEDTHGDQKENNADARSSSRQDTSHEDNLLLTVADLGSNFFDLPIFDSLEFRQWIQQPTRYIAGTEFIQA